MLAISRQRAAEQSLTTIGSSAAMRTLDTPTAASTRSSASGC
jgi:hypothetical protein